MSDPLGYHATEIDELANLATTGNTGNLTKKKKKRLDYLWKKYEKNLNLNIYKNILNQNPHFVSANNTYAVLDETNIPYERKKSQLPNRKNGGNKKKNNKKKNKKIKIGPRGGKYILVNGKKKYLKN